MKENPLQIAQLREITGCSLSDAARALALREGILTFAVEYLGRRDIPAAISPAERFPMWQQYLDQRKKSK